MQKHCVLYLCVHPRFLKKIENRISYLIAYCIFMLLQITGLSDLETLINGNSHVTFFNALWTVLEHSKLAYIGGGGGGKRAKR